MPKAQGGGERDWAAKGCFVNVERVDAAELLLRISPAIGLCPRCSSRHLGRTARLTSSYSTFTTPSLIPITEAVEKLPAKLRAFDGGVIQRAKGQRREGRVF